MNCETFCQDQIGKPTHTAITGEMTLLLLKITVIYCYWLEPVGRRIGKHNLVVYYSYIRSFVWLLCLSIMEKLKEQITAGKKGKKYKEKTSLSTVDVIVTLCML